MRVSRLSIETFRGITKAELHFTSHTLLIGGNNVGKSTICEALDLVLGPDRLNQTPKGSFLARSRTHSLRARSGRFEQRAVVAASGLSPY